MDCPRTADDLLKLVKSDVVITNLKYKAYFTKLIYGVKALLKFVRESDNEFYMIDCIRSTSQGTERISKSSKGAQHAIFYFPGEQALPEKRMWRSRWKNKYLDADQEVKYMIMERTAREINKGTMLLPDECIGQPMFLLHEGHLNTVRRSLNEEERSMFTAANRVLAKGKNDSKPKPSVLKTRRRKQYLKWAKNRKEHWIRRGGFITTLADVASTFASQRQNLQVVLPPKKLLRDKVSECPHHCGNRIILKKGMPFNSYIKCSNCGKKIRVRFYPKENDKVSL